MQRRGLTRADFVSRIGQAENRGGALSFNSIIPLNNGAEFYSFGGLNYRNGKSAAFHRQPAQLTQNISEIYPLGFLPIIETNNYDQSLSAGLRGKIGDWNADLSNTYGRNKIDFSTTNTLNASLLKASPTRFDDGGYRFLQNTTNLDLNRNFADLLNGINVAFGFEHRFENYQIAKGQESSYVDYGKAIKVGVDATGKDIIIPDITGNIQQLRAQNGSPYAGGAQAFPGFRPENAVNATRSAIAAYTDFEIKFSKAWLIDAALRYENYSDFGSTLNWKLATRYKLGVNWTLRAAASTGFRAPSLQQRYFSATSSVFTDGQIVQSGTFTNDSRPAKLLGIPDLKQETSQSYSAGVTGKWGVFLRNVYFGPVDAATNVVADYQTFGGKVVTDLSASYSLLSNLRLTLGANNILGIYPDKTIGGNTGAGYFLYSRTSQQFGFNGRFIFARLALTL